MTDLGYFECKLWIHGKNSNTWVMNAISGNTTTLVVLYFSLGVTDHNDVVIVINAKVGGRASFS
jgi:hypothetical protein